MVSTDITEHGVIADQLIGFSSPPKLPMHSQINTQLYTVVHKTCHASQVQRIFSWKWDDNRPTALVNCHPIRCCQIKWLSAYSANVWLSSTWLTITCSPIVKSVVQRSRNKYQIKCIVSHTVSERNKLQRTNMLSSERNAFNYHKLKALFTQISR